MAAEKNSYLRAIREVEGGHPGLERLIGALGDHAIDLFEDKDSVLRKTSRLGQTGALQAGYHGRGIGIPSVLPYTNGLRYTHFEISVPPSEGNNGRLRRLYAKSSRISAGVGMAAESLMVRSSQLVLYTRPKYANLGEELALQIDTNSSEATILDEQNALINNAVRGVGAGHDSTRPYSPLPLVIPIAFLPKKLQSAAEYVDHRDQLIDEVSAYVPEKSFELGRIVWQTKS
ncbi:MAG: hypothetical protein ABI602_04055 [Candidatus Saccharibacteria bacterium]